MADITLTNPQRPRAIAKEKDGIVLYWVEELQVAGLHVQGLAKLLQCGADLVSDTIKRLETVGQVVVLQAETVTTQGLRTVGLVTESDLSKVLRSIERSKAKEETRERAGDVRDQLAAAGFKLMVMLELAPQQLKAQLDAHVLPSTFAEALQLAANQAREIEIQQVQITSLEQTTERQAEIIDELFDYSSIIRIAKYNKCSEKAFSWHKLKAASKAICAEIKKAPSNRYEYQNLYSHDAWRLAYPEYRLPETTTLVIRGQA
jgi:hypothetical protein